jgi:hypothetical protein
MLHGLRMNYVAWFEDKHVAFFEDEAFCMV